MPVYSMKLTRQHLFLIVMALFCLLGAVRTFMFARLAVNAVPVSVTVLDNHKISRRRSVFVEYNSKKYKIEYNTEELNYVNTGDVILVYYLKEKDAIIPDNVPEYRFTYIFSGLFVFWVVILVKWLWK